MIFSCVYKQQVLVPRGVASESFCATSAPHPLSVFSTRGPIPLLNCHSDLLRNDNTRGSNHMSSVTSRSCPGRKMQTIARARLVAAASAKRNEDREATFHNKKTMLQVMFIVLLAVVFVLF